MDDKVRRVNYVSLSPMTDGGSHMNDIALRVSETEYFFWFLEKLRST